MATSSKNRAGENLPVMLSCAPGQDRREEAHGDRVDVEQRQDQQAVVGLGQAQVLAERRCMNCRFACVSCTPLGRPVDPEV